MNEHFYPAVRVMRQPDLSCKQKRETNLQHRNRIRVMIVDDHETLREGMATFLHTLQDLELVGMAADGVEALNLCRVAQPDVVLMDLMMPGVDGIDATRAICALCPDVHVLVLTSFGWQELIQAALDAGAEGYVLKTVSADELADAIRAVYAGRPVAQSGGSGSKWQN